MTGELEMLETLETQGPGAAAPSPRVRVRSGRDPDQLASALEEIIRDRVLPMGYALAGSVGPTRSRADRQLEAVIGELDELAQDLRRIAVELRHQQ